MKRKIQNNGCFYENTFIFVNKTVSCVGSRCVCVTLWGEGGVDVSISILRASVRLQVTTVSRQWLKQTHTSFTIIGNQDFSITHDTGKLLSSLVTFTWTNWKWNVLQKWCLSDLIREHFSNPSLSYIWLRFNCCWFGPIQSEAPSPRYCSQSAR